MEKAITIVERALHEFQVNAKMVPRVILLPVELFQKYEQERLVLDGLLGSDEPDESERWAEIRVVEHDGIDEIEVF